MCHDNLGPEGFESTQKLFKRLLFGRSTSLFDGVFVGPDMRREAQRQDTDPFGGGVISVVKDVTDGIYITSTKATI